ncbi:gag/pol protein [Cucumis melo var. makuwa]|uniref:Gag/pol protein n=1 Tax=Cucumis melo var. makuwa TaxID=1194695 RepID=A0A5A7UL66_CUCMM|nr:gag/pol protein [Cucumis melo var. makuwa]
MNSSIVQLLAFEKLNGDNYAAWKSNLNTKLMVDDLRFVLTEECPQTPASNANRTSRKAYDRWIKANEKAHVYIFASMSDVLAKRHESLATTKEIMDSLKGMFGQPEWSLRHEAIKYIYTKRMKEETSVREHVLDMMMHFNIAEVNGGAIDEAISVSKILPKENSSWKRLSKGEITLKVGTGEMVLAKAGYALEIAIYILNNVLSKSVSKTPYELWKGRKGYPKESKGGLFYDAQENKVFVSTNATFLEEDHIRNHQTRSKLVLEEISKNTTDRPSSSTKIVDKTRNIGQTHPSQELGEPRRSGRVGRQSDRYLDLSEAQIIIPDDGIEDPLTYKQAMNDVDCDQWIKAMDLEMESMYSNSVWTLVGHLTDIKKWLATQFQMKDLGNAQHVLDMEFIYQKNHVQRHLKKLEDISNIPYAFVFGSLMYAMLCTRPDACYSVGMVSRYQSNPGRDHWTAVKNILKYLRRIKDYMLVYGSKDLILTGYTDSDFQTDKDARKSTSGSVFTLNEGAVVWRSIKQSYIVDSTMEAEYVAACKAAKEAVWLKKFLTYLEVVLNMHMPITIYCDNSGAIANSREPRSHKRGKHIERRYHLIREIIHRGDVTVTKISSEQNMVDPFTKALTAKVFESHLHGLGLRGL